jgi:antitoxin ParD1/3/4
MPSKSALNVSLTEQLCDFIKEQVRSGRYRSASEVVRAALRLMQDTSYGPARDHRQATADQNLSTATAALRIGTRDSWCPRPKGVPPRDTFSRRQPIFPETQSPG